MENYYQVTKREMDIFANCSDREIEEYLKLKYQGREDSFLTDRELFYQRNANTDYLNRNMRNYYNNYNYRNYPDYQLTSGDVIGYDLDNYLSYTPYERRIPRNIPYFRRGPY